MIDFSPGLAQSSFELLELISRREVPLSQIKTEFSKIGVMPVDSVIQSAKELNWISTAENGLTIITVNGQRILSLIDFESRTKQALLDYIDTYRPAWLQNAPYGRTRVLAYAASGIKQTFIEAGLAKGTDKYVVAFWDELAIRARGQTDNRLNEIGRTGERLTIAHETVRTGEIPRWVSIDNNADGYDVLSIAGPSDRKKLLIEVKTTTLGYYGSFHISANEWECATSSENHVFHLWDLSNNLPSLAVITKSELVSEIPINQGRGFWESVEVPFIVFKNKFFVITDLQTSTF